MVFRTLPPTSLEYLEYYPSKWATRKSFEQEIKELLPSLRNRLFQFVESQRC